LVTDKNSEMVFGAGF